MKQRTLLTALAGWLALPVLTMAQPDGPRFTRAPGTQTTQAATPTQLPSAASGDKPVPKHPAAEIIAPKKIESQPTVTIEEVPSDPRLYNQRWLPGKSSIEDCPTDTPARCAFEPDANHMVWVVPEWLVWKATGMHVPPLITASSTGASQGDAGVIGVGDTRVLFGNDSQLKSFRSGVRVRAGLWLESSQTLGLEASVFYLGQKSYGVTYQTSGATDSLARPFFDVLNNARSSEVIAFSTVNADGSLNSTIFGTFTARTTTDLWGADFNLRRYLCATQSFRLDGLLGFRYQRLRDTLETNSNSTINADGVIGNLTAGTDLKIQDFFHTTSNFYGGQLGLTGNWQIDRWYVGLTGKVAMGVAKHEVLINGLTTITAPGASEAQVTVGGLLAQGTNIGRHRTDRFSVIPEVGINLGYQLASNIRLFAGYSVLYWSNVVRAGDQIDLTVNTTQVQRSTTSTATLTGTPRPAYGSAFRESGFWAHGANLGLEFRW